MQQPELTATRITDDIIALDKANMAPLLAQHGQQFDEIFVRKDISRHNPGLKNVIFHYDGQDLQGYFRFNFEGERQILVRSFQLHPTASHKVLKQLLIQAHRVLQQEALPDHTRIYAIVNSFNSRSIYFQEKLGFQFDTGDRQHCRFSTTKADLITRLPQAKVNPDPISLASR